MPTSDRVLITGAGPVGLVAAANLVRHGVPVTVFEGGPDLSTESRASTFHPPTLDMLGDLDVARPLIAQGLIAPKFQYRNRRDGLIAQFDFSDIAEVVLAEASNNSISQLSATKSVLAVIAPRAEFRLLPRAK